ncbi:outer membrane lipoprotein carrier protein LolA [Flavobacteriaceae bacterium]|nr:outer membrane lipoprotein carrier protein LolA [Flavobacteriaceae bacterium]
MRNPLYVYIVFLSFNLSTAQTSEAAMKLLDDVSKNIASYNNLSFDFSYVLENRQEKIKQETSGSVTLEGDRYKLMYLGAEQLFDGEKTYTIIPENEEITINGAEEDGGLGINPTELLNFYKEGYDYQWDIKQNIFGRPIQFVKLIPSDENKDISYLLLGVDILNKTIYRLIEIGSNSTRTTLTLSNQITNINLAEDFFKFDASRYPDYFINN